MGNSACGIICEFLIVAFIISMFIQSCIWADYGRWVHYDDQACEGGTLRGTFAQEPRWEAGRCEVLSSGMEPKSRLEGRRYRTYYQVHHQVRLSTDDGTGRHVARAYKAPAWARGPGKLQNGGNYRRMFKNEGEAGTFMGNFLIGSTHKCYYNPSDPQEVSWRCRDRPMRVRYAAGTLILFVLLAPFGIFICALAFASG